MHANALASTPTLRNSKAVGNINFPGNDAPGKRDMQNVTEIDGGIVDYVRQRMGFERVTREVIRQAVAFEREMRSMNGW